MVKFNTNNHLIFSDESGWDSNNRYGCLAMVSGSYHDTRELNNRLKLILEKHQKREIKFHGVKNNQSKVVACEFLDCSIEYLRSSKIKIHVLVWDKQDERHNILGRCDLTNLKMMYYNNLKVLLRHWLHIDTTWSFYPDEFTAIDWENDIIKYLRNTRIGKTSLYPELFETFSKVEFPSYSHTQELDSNHLPMLQLADLYAGIVRTSRSESNTFMQWFKQKNLHGQLSAFAFDEPVNVSKSAVPRFEVMYHFKCNATRHRMGVSLNDSGYFKTFHKKNNLFIWHYEPQGSYDKAPVKNKK